MDPLSEPYGIISCKKGGNLELDSHDSSQERTNLQYQKFEANLTSGASLRLHLREGDFRVIGSDSERISVRVEGKN